MARTRDYAAEYARRQEVAAARGTTPYAERVARLELQGFTRTEARGHGELSVREARTMGLVQARAAISQQTGRPVAPDAAAAERFRRLGATDAGARRQRAFLNTLYADTDLPLRLRYAAYYGS